VAREESGRSIRDWAQELNIKRDYLEALEECRFEDLPEAVLAKGHLRRYAEALGLDPEPLVAQYPVRPTFTPPSVISPKKPRRRAAWWPWLLLVLLLALAGGLAWWLTQPRQAAPAAEIELTPPPEPPPPPAESTLSVITEPPGAVVWLDGFRLGKSPVQGSFSPGTRQLRVEAEGYQTFEKEIVLEPGGEKNLKVTLTPLPKEEEPAAKGPPRITLRFTEKAWVRVTTPDGEKLYEGIPKVGSEQTYDLPVIVRTGNAAGVHVIVAGQDQGALGGEGLIVERRFDPPEQP